MNFATTTMERVVPMHTQNTMTQAKQTRPTLQHRDANPVLYLGVVLGFILIVWSVFLAASYYENGRPAKSHASVKASPPIFVRQ